MAGLNPQTEQLLASSIKQYRKVLQHAEKLMEMLAGFDYSGLYEHADMLQRLQDEACKQDDVLVPLLQVGLTDWEKHTVYQKRMHLIKSILDVNRLLVPKIRASMAVTSAELDQMRGNRTALAGYGSQAVDRRGNRGIG